MVKVDDLAAEFESSLSSEGKGFIDDWYQGADAQTALCSGKDDSDLAIFVDNSLPNSKDLELWAENHPGAVSYAWDSLRDDPGETARRQEEMDFAKFNDELRCDAFFYDLKKRLINNDYCKIIGAQSVFRLKSAGIAWLDDQTAQKIHSFAESADPETSNPALPLEIFTGRLLKKEKIKKLYFVGYNPYGLNAGNGWTFLAFSDKSLAENAVNQLNKSMNGDPHAELLTFDQVTSKTDCDFLNLKSLDDADVREDLSDIPLETGLKGFACYSEDAVEVLNDADTEHCVWIGSADHADQIAAVAEAFWDALEGPDGDVDHSTVEHLHMLDSDEAYDGIASVPVDDPVTSREACGYILKKHIHSFADLNIEKFSELSSQEKAILKDLGSKYQEWKKANPALFQKNTKKLSASKGRK